MNNSRSRKTVVLAFASSWLGLATLVSLLATANDWRLNPGGIFRAAGGTEWYVVWQTFLSWQLPLLLILLPVFALLSYIWLKIAGKYLSPLS